MNDTGRAAERITGALSDPAWHPRRHHIEGARNELATASERIEKLRAALGECRLQIEYLESKFQPTGTGAAVLAKIDAALSR